MFLGLISGLVGALFSSTSISVISAVVEGKGFWEFYSTSAYVSRAISSASCKQYITYMINQAMDDSSPGFRSKANEIIQDLAEISEFEVYDEDKCQKMINTISYNQGAGKLFLYIHTFAPSIHPTKGKIVKTEYIKISVKLELAKDWMIVTKGSGNFFGCSISQEIQYIPNKGIELKHIVEAISIALAPAVLGVVKLPDRFMNLCGSILRNQSKSPDPRVITAQTSQQAQQALSLFDSMAEKQKSLVKSGLSQIGGGLTK